MSETQVDLTRFCARGLHGRYDLRSPFSQGSYTFATDDSIMARVHRRAEVPERPDTPDAGRVWPKDWPDRFCALAQVRWPDAVWLTCDDCEGSGRQHACPACTCACPACEGFGLLAPERRVAIGRAHFQRGYIEVLLLLPGLEVEADPSPREPLRFRFTGGEGMLMPLRETGQEADVTLQIVTAEEDAA